MMMMMMFSIIMLSRTVKTKRTSCYFIDKHELYENHQNYTWGVARRKYKINILYSLTVLCQHDYNEWTAKYNFETNTKQNQVQSKIHCDAISISVTNNIYKEVHISWTANRVRHFRPICLPSYLTK